MDLARPGVQVGLMADTRAWFAVEKLDVFRAASELMQLTDGWYSRLGRRHGPVYQQLQRAVASIVANIGEGASSLGAADRSRFFEYAYRSAGEAASLILVLAVTRALSQAERDEALGLLHRIQSMLFRLIGRARRPSTNPPADPAPDPCDP
jgi:four helix bundle protein